MPITHRNQKLYLVLIVLLISCEKFTGYDYTTESIGVRSNVHGYVLNIFTGDPVPNANFSMGILNGTTDRNGEYAVDYLLGKEEQRNKEILFSIYAPNYFQLDTSLIIFPPETQFNLDMIYAAPIFEKVWWGGNITQVQVLDYQTVANIDTLFTVFYYVKMHSPEIKSDTVGMRFYQQISERQALYQAIGHVFLGDFEIYGRKLRIFALDNDAFSDTLRESDQALFTPTKLFPIEF